MGIGNLALADVLSRRGTPRQMLAALGEQGILVATRPDRSVVLGTTPAGDRVLLGYTVPQTYSRHGGRHTLTPCDAATLLDIYRVTGVRDIVVDAAGPAAVAIPLEDLKRFMTEHRALLTAPAMRQDQPAAPPRDWPSHPSWPPRPAPQAWPQRPLADPHTPPYGTAAAIPQPAPLLPYRRSRHPAVGALRTAISLILPDFPQVHHVWISDAPSGDDVITLHVKVHSSIAQEVADDLHHAVRSQLVRRWAGESPQLIARVADVRTERQMLELGAHVVCADVHNAWP